MSAELSHTPDTGPEKTKKSPQSSLDIEKQNRENINVLTTKISTALGTKFDQQDIPFDIQSFKKNLTQSIEKVFLDPNIPDIAKEKFKQDILGKLELLAQVTLADIDTLRTRRNIESGGVWEYEMKQKYGNDEAKIRAHHLGMILNETIGKYVQPTADGLMAAFSDKKESKGKNEYHGKTLETFSGSIQKLDTQYGLNMSAEIEKIANDFKRNTKGDISQEDLYRQVGVKIVDALNSMRRIPDANRVKQFIMNGNLTERSKGGKLTEALTSSGTKDIVDIVLEYKEAIHTFQGTEREIRDARSTALSDSIGSKMKDAVGMEGLKSEFDHLKSEDIEKKMKNASLADFVIMGTQLAQIAPILGNIGGGALDIGSAITGISSDGAKLSKVERAFSGIFGTLGLTVFLGWISRASKTGKMAGIISGLRLGAKYLSDKIDAFLKAGGKLSEQTKAALSLFGKMMRKDSEKGILLSGPTKDIHPKPEISKELKSFTKKYDVTGRNRVAEGTKNLSRDKRKELLEQYYLQQKVIQEQFYESLLSRDVERITRENNLVFIHGINHISGEGRNTGMNNNVLNTSQLTFESMLSFLSSHKPTISASLIDPGNTNSSQFFYPMGVILGKGRLLTIHNHDAGTVAHAIDKRVHKYKNPGLLNSGIQEFPGDAELQRIAQAQSRLTQSPVNEAIVESPEIVGVFYDGNTGNIRAEDVLNQVGNISVPIYELRGNRLFLLDEAGKREVSIESLYPSQLGDNNFGITRNHGSSGESHLINSTDSGDTIPNVIQNIEYPNMKHFVFEKKLYALIKNKCSGMTGDEILGYLKDHATIQMEDLKDILAGKTSHEVDSWMQQMNVEITRTGALLKSYNHRGNIFDNLIPAGLPVGRNENGLYVDRITGMKYFVKRKQSFFDQNATEHLSNKLLEKMGIRVSESQYVDNALVIKRMEGEEVIQLGEHITRELVLQLRKSFIFDLWLRNFNPFGKKLSNIRIVNGFPVRIRQESTFHFLDDQNLKESIGGNGDYDISDDFNILVKREDDNNEISSIYSTITNSEIVDQVRQLKNVMTNDVIGSLVEAVFPLNNTFTSNRAREYTQLLIQRRDAIIRRFLS